MKGNGRACIKYKPDLSCYSKGTRPTMFNPDFPAPPQNAPTDAHPVSQHKQMKGHSISAGKIKGIPK